MRFCTGMEITLKPFALVCIVVPLVNDTPVLLAVTVGLGIHTHLEPNSKQKIRTMIYGNYSPASAGY